MTKLLLCLVVCIWSMFTVYPGKACLSYNSAPEEHIKPILPARWKKTQDYESLNFVMIGDIGGMGMFPYTTYDQIQTAIALASVAETFPLDFIAELGDNFYNDGVQNVNDTRFKTTFEDVYTGDSIINVPWYITAGNHDYDGNVSAQIEYSNVSERWNYPSLYYSKVFSIPGSNSTLKLIMLDTMLLCGNINVTQYGTPPTGPSDQNAAELELAWLQHELSSSSDSYVIVGGHYPVWSIGGHGPTDCMLDKVKPLLEKYHVSAFFGGHDHNLQHIHEIGSNVEYFISGAGHLIDWSKDFQYRVPSTWQRFTFLKGQHMGGFAYISATADNMTVTFTDAVDMLDLYEVILQPRFNNLAR